MLAEVLKFARQQNEPSISRNDKKDDDQGRKDPFRAPGIKIPKTESSAIEVFTNDRGDQKARNDKENIDADVSACKCPDPCVEANYGQDCDGPQSVNVRPVGRCIRARATHRWQSAMRTRRPT